MSRVEYHSCVMLFGGFEGLERYTCRLLGFRNTSKALFRQSASPLTFTNRKGNKERQTMVKMLGRVLSMTIGMLEKGDSTAHIPKSQSLCHNIIKCFTKTIITTTRMKSLTKEWHKVQGCIKRKKIEKEILKLG